MRKDHVTLREKLRIHCGRLLSCNHKAKSRLTSLLNPSDQHILAKRGSSLRDKLMSFINGEPNTGQFCRQSKLLPSSFSGPLTEQPLRYNIEHHVAEPLRASIQDAEIKYVDVIQ